ncbi:hypothetical protein AGMMS49525_00020 [Bacteroidia bacterium]|nr:hypothetical protein AGMMS49525_00020 [Bacteroidia bacterium]
MKKFKILLATLLLSASGASAATYYVDASRADDSGDGLSWANAKQTIAAIYTAAASGDEVWVKAGDYTITAAIALNDGVAIYGGFDGTEATIAARAKVPGGKPWEFTNVSKVTHLTGSVFTSSSATAATTIIDGLTIEGNTTGTGIVYAVAYSGSSGGITVRNSIIQNTNQASNPSTTDHGGLQFKGSDCVAEYCLIQGNKGKNGGGAYIERGTLRNSEIKNNWTRSDGAGSAGNAGNAGNGGGVFLLNGGKVYNCLIEGNTSSYGGGAFMGNSNTDLLYNNIIVNNTATNGSGISYDSRNATGGTVYNNIIANNIATATGGGGIFISKGSTVSNSIFFNNTDGAGVVNIDLDASTATTPAFSNSIIDADDTKYTGVTFTNCVTEANGASIFANTTSSWAPLAGFAGKEAGDATSLTFADNKDITGDARESGTIDIGPYEVQDKNVVVTVDGSSDAALTSPAIAGTYPVTFADDYTVTFTTANAPIAKVDGIDVSASVTGTGPYSLTVSSIVAPTTAIYISAAQPKTVTVTNTAGAPITITNASATEVSAGSGTYNVPQGQSFTLNFTAEGYNPTATIDGAPYSFAAPAAGVYTLTATINANTAIELDATIQTFPVTITKGADITWSGTAPTDRAVDWDDTYSFAFTLPAGYHSPVVTVNGTLQTVGAPVSGVYTVDVTNIKAAQTIAVLGAYPDDVIPVSEDTYIRFGSGHDGTNFSNNGTLDIRYSGDANRSRAFLKFDVPAGFTLSDKKAILVLTVANPNQTGFKFEVRGDIPATAKGAFSTLTWTNSGVGLVPDETVIPGTDSTLVTVPTGQTVGDAYFWNTVQSVDVTPYVASVAGVTAIYLSITEVNGGGGFLRFYSREAANYEYVPQLVFTPQHLVTVTAPAQLTDITASTTEATEGSGTYKVDEGDNFTLTFKVAEGYEPTATVGGANYTPLTPDADSVYTIQTTVTNAVTIAVSATKIQVPVTVQPVPDANIQITAGATGTIDYGDNYTVKYKVLNASYDPYVEVNGTSVGVGTYSAGDDEYTLTISAVKVATTIEISAIEPQTVTVNYTGDSESHVTVTSHTGASPYTTKKGAPFVFKFKANEGYTVSATLDGAAYTLSAPVSDVYTITTGNIEDDNTVIELTTVIIPLAVGITPGANVVLQGTPAASVNYFDAYTFSFTTPGYHLPTVTVNGTPVAAGVPVAGVYTVTVPDVRTALTIEASVHYATNVIPVSEDTYVRSDGANNAIAQSANAELEVRDYSTSALCRSFLEFVLPTDIALTGKTVLLNLTVSSLANSAYAFSVREVPALVKHNYAALTWSNADLPTPADDAVISAKATLTAAEAVVGATVKRDITAYVVAEKAAGRDTIFLQLTDGGTGFTRFKSAENGDIDAVPQLVIINTPELSVDKTEVAFGNIVKDASSPAQTVTVSATNLADTIAYTLTGDDAAFAIDPTAWTSAAGGDLSIVFTPTEEKAYAATLTITTLYGTSKVIALTGTGIADDGGEGNNGGANSIDDLDAGTVKVYVQDGILYVEVATAQPVKVYTIAGTLVLDSVIDGKTSIALPKGVYVVKVGTQTRKVIL